MYGVTYNTARMVRVISPQQAFCKAFPLGE